MSYLHSLLAVGGIGNAEILVICVLGFIMALVLVLPFWFICKKAGMSPWLSLIAFVPLGTLILLFVLAFSDWPALKKDEQLRY